MNSKMPIRLIMFDIWGRMFRIVSISSLIAIEALTRRKILMILKPRMTEVVAPIDSPVPINFIRRPKFVPITIKQSKTFQPWRK